MRSVARRLAVALTPLVVNLTMPSAFEALGRRLGPRHGYVIGFLVYWAICFLVPAAILGSRRAAGLLHDERWPGPVEAVALALPPLGGLATEALPAWRAGVRIDRPLLATATAFAATNAIAEELLWRGLPGAVFAENRILGWVYPAIGFGLWHLAPQRIHPARRPLVFCAEASVLGLVNGWLAGRLGGIGAVTLSHALADATGLRTFAQMLGRDEPPPDD